MRRVKGMIENYQVQTDKGGMELLDTVFGGNMANLSMNLAGGLFDTHKEGHLPFLPETEYGKERWDGKKVDKKEFLSVLNYSQEQLCFGLCFYVNDIYGKTFPFYKGFNTQTERDEYDERVQQVAKGWAGDSDSRIVGAFVNKRTPVEVKGRLIVHHVPTNGNYWHTTLDTYRPADECYVKPDERLKSSDKHMFKALKQNLLQCCYIDTIPDYTLSCHDYVRCFV